MNPSNPKLENIYTQLLAFKKLKIQQGGDSSLVDELIAKIKKEGNFNDKSISNSSVEEACNCLSNCLTCDVKQFEWVVSYLSFGKIEQCSIAFFF